MVGKRCWKETMVHPRDRSRLVRAGRHEKVDFNPLLRPLSCSRFKLASPEGASVDRELEPSHTSLIYLDGSRKTEPVPFQPFGFHGAREPAHPLRPLAGSLHCSASPVHFHESLCRDPSSSIFVVLGPL